MCPVIFLGNLSYTAISWSVNFKNKKMEKEKRIIYYATNRKEEIARLQAEYSLPSGYNINGEVECMLSKDDIKNLKEEEKKGLIQIRKK